MSSVNLSPPFHKVSKTTPKNIQGLSTKYLNRNLENELINFLEQAPIAIHWLDDKGRVIWANQAELSLLGYEREAYIGQNIINFYHDRKLGKTIFQKLLNGEAIYNQEIKLKHKNGLIRYALLNANAHFENGKFLYTRCFTEDITEQKIKDEVLRETRESFKALADSAPIMIWMTGPDKKAIYFNKGWLAFTGNTLHQELTSDWTEDVHPDDESICLDTYVSSFDAQIDFQVEYRLKRYDGAYRWILETGSPRFGNRGEFLGYIGTCVDITERKDLERKKDEFIGIASHELKTPLTTIKAFNQILLLQAKDLNVPNFVNYLNKMDAHIDKLSDLISDFLDITRIEQGKLRFKKEKFDLNSLIADAVEDTQAISKKHLIQVSGKCSKQFYGDINRINQVLINLLSNAIKYSSVPDQSKEIKKINVTIQDNKKSVTLGVQDFGIGIPKQNLEKVFNRFFRVEGPKSETYPGLGLGLYIASEIVKRHGGRIWVESIRGRGSTFFVNLPYTNKE